MENYFEKFRRNIVGIDYQIETPYHNSIPLIYSDWTASGRMYRPIEDKFMNEIYPLVANTHTDTNLTGLTMTYAYHKAQQIIKKHVGANDKDVLISTESGMTGVVNKLQRILGLKLHESFKKHIKLIEEDRPVIFVTHMEHHSNQTSWEETIADVIVVPCDEQGLVDLDQFRAYIAKYSNRKNKIAAITSCSNVTGIITPYYEIAQIIHEYGGFCFVDFACSAPYIDINMHLSDEDGKYLDAIYFSPHKFLGGPGASGIVIFGGHLYHNLIPDNPGGGTVEWTNPWGGHRYINDIEAREDGGTPSFIQTMRAAMCIKLKEEMGVENIEKREKEIIEKIWSELEPIPNFNILASHIKNRLGVISFYIDDLHYNIGVKILNDRFGIQVRGGCLCAGTYGHYLFNVSMEMSKEITDLINIGDYSKKPGWIRLSVHPTNTDQEIKYICESLKALSENHQSWALDYDIDLKTGNIKHKTAEKLNQVQENINRCLALNYY